MKRLAVFLVALTFGSLAMAQSFTTPDGAFSARILDGAIDSSHSHDNTYMWQTFNADHTESVAVLEQVHNPATSDLQGELDAVRDGALSAGGVLLDDKNGTFNGFGHSKQFTIQLLTKNGVSVTYTVRAWVSKTGKTIYAMSVYELSSNLPASQNRVTWFLDTATLPN